jgi:hypothetical protein
MADKVPTLFHSCKSSCLLVACLLVACLLISCYLHYMFQVGECIGVVISAREESISYKRSDTQNIISRRIRALSENGHF